MSRSSTVHFFSDVNVIFDAMVLFETGSSMLKNLSVAILQLNEAGELSYLRTKWWASSCVPEGAKASSLRAHGMKGIFLVLAIGLGIGVLISLFELTSKSRSTAGEQKASSTYTHANKKAFMELSGQISAVQTSVAI